MSNPNQRLTRRLPELSLALFSFLGFTDSLLLTARHYRGLIVLCSLTSGCDQVLSSRYSTIHGISLALFGVLYYLCLFILALYYLRRRSGLILRLMVAVTTVGFLASVWFVYLQIFVLRQVCLYCMMSAVAATLLFVVSLFILVFRSQEAFRLR